MSGWRHLRAIVLLPGVVTLLVPGVIVWQNGAVVGWPAVPGAVSIGIGLVLFVSSVALFVRIGRGTLAPWDPTSRLVVRGPYRYVRNPMISGVLFILLGEAGVTGSVGVLTEFGVFFAMNAVYFPLFEEPGLVRRFGADYERYRAHVPRWLPRLTPWSPDV